MSLYDHARATVAASEPADLRLEQAFEVLRAYDEARAGMKPRHGSVADAAGLPHPKETIKWALMLVMGAVDPDRREPLKAGYLSLADWQVAEEVEAGGFDSSRLRHKIDPLSLAREFAARATPGDRWIAAARDEQSTLIAELRRKGFWYVATIPRTTRIDSALRRQGVLLSLKG